jgi:putative endonuclease
MYFVYILHSASDQNLYTGFTENLDKRIQEHNDGLNLSTKHRRPLELIYYEAYYIKGDALAREKFLKSGSGKNYLKKQLKHYFMNNAEPNP